MPTEENRPLLHFGNGESRQHRFPFVVGIVKAALALVGLPHVPHPSRSHSGNHSGDRDDSTPRRPEVISYSVLQDIFWGDARVWCPLKFSPLIPGRSSRQRNVMVLTKESMEWLIEKFGNRTIRFSQEDNKKSLIHHIIEIGAVDCAEILFKFAAKERLVVPLTWSDGDILKSSLDKYSRECVKFVLEKMSQRVATADETVRVLSRNLEKLLERFPAVIEEFLQNDRFCFTQREFSVPKSIFDGTNERPIGTIHLYDRGELKWEETDDASARNFWKDERPDLKNSLDSTDGEQVMAVSKFVAIEDAVVSDSKVSIAVLTAAKCAVQVFKCEAIKTNVHWKWHNYLGAKYLFSNIMYLIAVFFFFVFATYYGDIACDNDAWNVADITGDLGHSNLIVARSSLVCSFIFMSFPFVLRPSSSYSWLFMCGLGIEAYLLGHAFYWKRHTTISAFVVSVQCLVILFKTLQYLRPFRRSGLFITMISYLLIDILPFLFIGSILIICFGVALFVLLGRSYQSRDPLPSTQYNETVGGRGVTNPRHEFEHALQEDTVEEMMAEYRKSFASVWRCFEYLLYAIVGNFETEAFHLSSDSQLSAWIVIFFSFYVLAAAIVLLSLLISVLSNTFDRVMTHEEAEFIKHRAQRITAFERMNMLWKKLRPWSRTHASPVATTVSKKYYYHDGHIKPAYDKLAVFHFLVPAESAVVCNEDKGAWHGRVHAVARATQELIEQQKVEAERERQYLEDQIAKVKKDFRCLQESIQEKQDKIIDSVSRIAEETKLLRQALAANPAALEHLRDGTDDSEDNAGQTHETELRAKFS